MVARGVDYAKRHPDQAFLVIEVAASSLEYDRETKARLYAASNVDEYWIVDVEGRAIEVLSAAKDGVYGTVARHGVGAVVRMGAFPGVEVGVDGLFV